MTKYYHIGDHRLQITGAEVEAIEQIYSFTPFETLPPEHTAEEQEPFILRLEPEQKEREHFPICNINEMPLYTFNFEEVECSFFRPVQELYTLYMSVPEAQPLLLCCYPAGRECIITGNKTPRLLHFALWMGYGLLTAAHQTVAIHSSAISYGGKAILFLGESGTGKSTHTRLWQEHIPGATLLNDDSPLLRFCDGLPYAYGSPWSGKTPCYRNERLELAAIVRLSQAPHNHIRQLTTLEAVGALYPSCPPALARDEALAELFCATLSKVLSCIPVYHLACLPNAEAARLAFRQIFPSASVNTEK